MPIARCCTATRRNCARCARLTGSKRCISRGILGQRLRNARPPPSSSSKMLRSTLSLSLSPPPLPRQSPRPPLPTQTVGVDDAVGQRCRAGAFVRPTPTSLLPPLFTLPLHSRSLSRSLPPPPVAPTPLRFAHLPRTDVPDQPLLPPRFLSFFLSLSFAQREVVFSSRDLSVQHRPLFAAPLLKGVKVLFVSFLLFFLYVMLEFWRDSERSK